MTQEIGRLKVDVLSDGEFRLDGGAMFGMVARERWEGLCPPDDRHRIRLATHGLLVRGPGYVLVLEPGIGGTVDRDAFAVTKEPSLETSLAAFGVAPADVTHVLLTHLHFDHAGGGDRFPAARYLVQDLEWRTARAPSVLHNRSYRAEDRLPEDRLTLLRGEAEPLPGIRVRPTGGHTPGHQVVILGDAALFWGDLFPTRHHLSPARTMAYDLEPLAVAERKAALLAESAERGWLNYLYHEIDPRPFRLAADRGRYSIVD
jgi:glyoxylase-like metal-dependent hydrolase (beta-lactamase superfamily II)